jgi:hypothetical protein
MRRPQPGDEVECRLDLHEKHASYLGQDILGVEAQEALDSAEE